VSEEFRTPRAIQLLARARKEAHRFNHNYIGTEHLLLGLLGLESCSALYALDHLGISRQALREKIETLTGRGPDDHSPSENLPFTPRVKKALAFAFEEARILHHEYIGTEHILLGIIRDGGGLAIRAFAEMDINPDVLREAVLKELDPNTVNERDEKQRALSLRKANGLADNLFESTLLLLRVTGNGFSREVVRRSLRDTQMDALTEILGLREKPEESALQLLVFIMNHGVTIAGEDEELNKGFQLVIEKLTPWVPQFSSEL
jgi:ATP-dependent Clp protease ATP-binding subunit ClpA